MHINILYRSVIMMTNSGYIKRLPIEEFEAQSRGGKVRTHTKNEFLVFLIGSNSCILHISYYQTIFFHFFQMFTSNYFSHHIANYLLICSLIHFYQCARSIYQHFWTLLSHFNRFTYLLLLHHLSFLFYSSFSSSFSSSPVDYL